MVSKHLPIALHRAILVLVSQHRTSSHVSNFYEKEFPEHKIKSLTKSYSISDASLLSCLSYSRGIGVPLTQLDTSNAKWATVPLIYSGNASCTKWSTALVLQEVWQISVYSAHLVQELRTCSNLFLESWTGVYHNKSLRVITGVGSDAACDLSSSRQWTPRQKVLLNWSERAILVPLIPISVSLAKPEPCTSSKFLNKLHDIQKKSFSFMLVQNL